MDDLICKLKDDHHKLDEVLFQLERDFEHCEPATFASPKKLQHINDAINFIMDFPTHWHHPIEEQIFKKLLEKNTPNQKAIKTIIAEHHNMEEEFREVVETFNKVVAGRGRPSDELLCKVDEFIQHQLDHQQREASLVYPLVMQYLSEREWQEIQQFNYQLPRNLSLQQHFSAMYQQLTCANRHPPHAGVFPE